MEISNELNVGSREQLRAWLSENHDSCDEVWIVCPVGCTPAGYPIWTLFMKRYVSAGSILPASGSATRCCNGSLPVKKEAIGPSSTRLVSGISNGKGR